MANNPLKFADPTGHYESCDDGACRDIYATRNGLLLVQARWWAPRVAWFNRTLHPKFAQGLGKYSIGRDIAKSGILNSVRFRDTVDNFEKAASFSNNLQPQGLYPIDLPPGWTQRVYDDTLTPWERSVVTHEVCHALQRVAQGQISYFPFGTLQREREATLIQNGLIYEQNLANGLAHSDANLGTKVQSAALLSTPAKAASQVLSQGGIYGMFENDTLSVDATIANFRRMGLSEESISDIYAAADLVYLPSDKRDGDR